MLFDLVPSHADALCAAAAAAAAGPPHHPGTHLLDDGAFGSPMAAQQPLSPRAGGGAGAEAGATAAATPDPAADATPATPEQQHPHHPVFVQSAADAEAAAESAAAEEVSAPHPTTPPRAAAAMIEGDAVPRWLTVDGMQAAGVALLAALLCATPQRRRGDAWAAHVDAVVVRSLPL